MMVDVATLIHAPQAQNSLIKKCVKTVTWMHLTVSPHQMLRRFKLFHSKQHYNSSILNEPHNS